MRPFRPIRVVYGAALLYLLYLLLSGLPSTVRGVLDGDEDAQALVLPTIEAVVVVIVVVWAAVSWGAHKRRRVTRERAVTDAAAVAAADDGSFAPDLVRQRGGELFLAVQDAWTRVDREALDELLDPQLAAAWREVLDDNERRGLRHRVEVERLRSVEYVGLSNRAGRSDDRVTVRVCAHLRDYVLNADGKLVPDDHSYFARPSDLPGDDVVERVEYWTLAPCEHGRGWLVHSIATDEDGRRMLDDEIVAAPEPG